MLTNRIFVILWLNRIDFFQPKEDPKIPMDWHYKFTEVPEGTCVDVKLSLLAKTFGTLDAEVVNQRASMQYEHDLQNLKVMLEAGVKVQAD